MHQLKNEKENLSNTLQNEKQEIALLKANHQHLIKELTRELEENHKKQVTSFEIRLQEKDREVANFQNTQSKLKSELQSANVSLSELSQQIIKTEELKESAEKRVTQLTQALEELNRSSAARVSEIEKQLNKKIGEKEEHVKSLTESINEHLKKLEATSKELDVSKRQIEDLKFKSDAVEVKYNNLQKEKNELQKEHSNLIKASESREKELLDVVEKAKKAEKQCRANEQILKETIERTNFDLNSLKKKYDDLSTRFERQEHTVTSLNEKLDVAVKEKIAKENEARDIKKNIDILKSEKEQLKQIRDKIQKDYEGKTGEVNQMSDKLNEIIDREDGYKKSITDLNRDLQDKNQENMLFREKEKEILSKYENLAASKQQLEDELNGKINYLVEENNGFSKEVKIKSDLICETESKLQNALKNINNLEEQLSDKDGTFKLLQDELDGLKTRLDQSQHAFNDKCQKIQSMEKEYQEQVHNLSCFKGSSPNFLILSGFKGIN